MSELNILCGASLFAKVAVKKSGICFHYICDNDLSKVGKLWEDIEIISYDEIKELLKQNEINMFLANRYTSETVKNLVHYFKNENFRLYGWISDDLKNLTEIKSILDYYKNCDLIKNTIFREGTSVRYKDCFSDDIFIYTMKKVGTMSIREGLGKALGVPQMHLHSLNSNLTGLEKETLTPYSQKTIFKVKDAIKNGKPLKVITSVREPVARNISFMFYILPRVLGEYAHVHNTFKTKYAYTEIFEDIYYKLMDHNYVLNWFDDEVNKYLGINIYEYPFDKEKGYSIIEKNNIKLLILKCEKLDNCAEIIQKFVGVEKFELSKENSSNDYWYKPIYDKFKSEFIPHEEYLKGLYDSKFMRYFYSDKEIQTFYRKWRRI